MWTTNAGRRLATVLYVHYLSKYLEFVDSFLMLLRQSWGQLSFLHIYHHASTAWSWYFIMRYNPGGDSYWCCAANSLVHVFMYTYYTMAAAGFSSRKNFIMKACKPWITRIQMIQFVTFLVQSVFLFVVPSKPLFLPRLAQSLEVFQGAMFLVLFLWFYIEDRRKAAADDKYAKNKKVEELASVVVTPLSEGETEGFKQADEDESSNALRHRN